MVFRFQHLKGPGSVNLAYGKIENNGIGKSTNFMKNWKPKLGQGAIHLQVNALVT